MINLTIREQLGLALYQEGLISGLRKAGDIFVNPGKAVGELKDKFVALNKKAWNKHTNSDKDKQKPTITTSTKDKSGSKQEPSKTTTTSSNSNHHQAGELDGRIKSKPKPSQDPNYHRADELDSRPSKTKPKPDKPEKSEGFTGAHAIGATMLATGIGLGAHSLYKKWKKKKKEKELRNKRY
jgi:hypothetical protein